MPKTLELLGSLVGFATESRTPNDQLQCFIAECVDALGARCRFIPGPEGRTNLLVSFGPDDAGGLMLSAHTDVVPAGDGWATPPYLLRVADGHAIGRGTADMKGFIACALTVLERLAVGLWRAPLHLAFSFDEEIGCAGMPSMLDHLASAANVRPDLVIVGEPTMMHPCHRHAGKVAYELTLRGNAGHSSRSPLQPSTITTAARIVMELDALQDRYRTPDENGIFPVTVNCGTVHGGTALNVIAEQCVVSFEIRHAPEGDPDELLRPIQQVIEGEHSRLAAVGGGIDQIEVTRYPGLASDPSHPLVRLVERIADTGLCHSVGYGTEGGLYARQLGVPVVICGPGDIAVAHRPDEYVSLQQLDSCEHFLHSLIESVCL